MDTNMAASVLEGKATLLFSPGGGLVSELWGEVWHLSTF